MVELAQGTLEFRMKLFCTFNQVTMISISKKELAIFIGIPWKQSIFGGLIVTLQIYSFSADFIQNDLEHILELLSKYHIDESTNHLE